MDILLRVFLDVVGDFLILLTIVFLCEWFAAKKGYNLFLRAWIITVMILMFLLSIGWYTFGKRLIWL
ncbi:hypothetical protein CJ195_11200 [Bacillus sp. UMB0899]|nr:hypothetical protein CJ195_11200 [Bacillus sp. UMB0899]